ncbi:hypothetical protein DYD21_17930 [Rhodohalobacter sp. SW132]|uniref:hypothetical protein n=1 Tax=Rhodohalobacter sp. SW132 TaxID=2293433 RepID=UPI000E235268|nr:hypothetical protein [Rhodohalobacter sp. SW132]REL24475.1 hypothetical protein DYD21_17930 [Rhodohalobacter sp. SW132]
MDEPVTISKHAPDQKSMDYELLRQEAINYIQTVAGKVWTDFNTHDPGVTILEVLCYAITDLGYRTSYDIKDLIATDPDSPENSAIQDFFTAAEVLPSAPVTANDYRKLMIDVAVKSSEAGCSSVGVKNAWIEKAKGPEHDIYVNKQESHLGFEPEHSGDEPLDLKILHNVLLEFDECETYGDLNDNKLVRDFILTEHTPDPELEGLIIRVEVEFPRWDDEETDFEDEQSIAGEIRDIYLTFLDAGGNYTFSYSLNSVNEVILSGTKMSVSGPVPIAGIEHLTLKLNQFIYDPNEGIIHFYRLKIAKIREIADQVEARVNANRNLCEDFMQFNALRIEEIIVCADIELTADTDVDRAQAEINHEIERFLSPTVHFYSLKEMTTRCFDQHRYDLTGVDTQQKIISIAGVPDPLPEPGAIVTITGSNNNNGQYTVAWVHVNPESENRLDIFVQETIPSDFLSDDDQLILADLEQEQCSPTESIFEGPLLNHGFIDDNELKQAGRRKTIYVSDLIQIIMDVPGVTAVRDIQIANLPQDNEDGSIDTKSVKWCLKLAYDENYVPRLNSDRSRFTFYKDQLPFRASRLTVDGMMSELRSAERPQKFYPSGPYDIAPPKGEYKNLEEYSTIQNDFPLVYGIGEEGVPTRSDQSIGSDLPTEIDALQLKGFLMHFDQLLANYLSQLAHVKELFSMNPQKDEFGNFVIGRTYYTQPLFDIVPGSEKLYFDEDGHAADLKAIAESPEQFQDRRNRFLDHLIARFSEQFTDYALLTSRLSGSKAQEELIEDKLAFLNGYPESSSRRGTTFDYRDRYRLWHKDNISGLEHRAGLLTGIDEREASTLHFSPNFKITGSEPELHFSIENSSAESVLKSPSPFETEADVKEALESVIVAGLHKDVFEIYSDDGSAYRFQLVCEGETIAESTKADYTSGAPGGDADLAIDETVDILTAEFFENPESNRHNLVSPLFNYFDYTIQLDMEANPPEFTIAYDLYNKPFEFGSGDSLLTGEYTGEGRPKEPAAIEESDPATSTFKVAGKITENLVEGDVVLVRNSVSNDGVYTISAFSEVGDSTEIIVDESIPSNTGPLGQLLYNIETTGGLSELAEETVEDVLWRVVSFGVRRTSYRFNPSTPPYTSPYTFRIYDRGGNLLGESAQFDFNEQPANEIQSVGSGTVFISNPDDETEREEYNTVNATARGPVIDVELDTVPTTQPKPGWLLEISDSFEVTALDQAGQTFTVDGDVTDRISPGESIKISEHASNDGSYLVLRITSDGSESEIVVKEPIPSGKRGVDPFFLSYSKSFEITKSSGSVVTIKGGADELAVEAMIRFLVKTFYSHEGMHLVEHLLLRPKVNGPHFVDADTSTLSDDLDNPGILTFTRQFPIAAADISSRTFLIEGDITPDLSAGKEIVVENTPLTNGSFTITSFTFSDPLTEIVVHEVLVEEIEAASPTGTLSYRIENPIADVDADQITITISGNVAESIYAGSLLEISGSEEGENDGRYAVLSAADAGTDTEIAIEKVESIVQDRLLSINLDEECECSLTDPYTCMAHVVLPYWPGRFINNDFRTFFEKTLRREAPAHVYVNICWVSNRHMAVFERAFKRWLIENSRAAADPVSLSNALGEWINSIEQLRNVYPTGTLHDCDEDENLENSIILNHSVLGEL